MITKIYTKNDKEKSQLINGFSMKNYSLMIFFDEPPNDFLKKEISNGKINIEKIEDGVFKVKPPYTYELLTKWLYYGNWQAIYPPKNNFQGMDTFRKKEEDVKNHLMASGIEMLIDSFHDDIEWNVFINQNAK